MNSSNYTDYQTRENQITELSTKIVSKIDALDKDIDGFFADTESKLVWRQKKNVLEAALAYLSGKYFDLEQVMQENPRYKDDRDWLGNWYPGSQGDTVLLVEEVKKIKAVAIMPWVTSLSPQLLFLLPADIFCLAMPSAAGISFNDTTVLMSRLSSTCHHFHSLFKQPLAYNASLRLCQLVIDDRRDQIKKILDVKPELLLIEPPKDFVIESQCTWQRFYAEHPLAIAVKRRQIKMIELLLPYYDQLEQSAAVMDAKEKYLSAWVFYETFINNQKEEEIVIPQEYAAYALELINVFSVETFPNGIPGANGNSWYVPLSEETEDALLILFNKLLPGHAVKLDDYFDVELLLLAVYKSYRDNFNLLQNWNQRDAFCIRVIGLIQGVQSPEIAKLFCEGLDDVVTSLGQGREREISSRARSHILKNGHAFYRGSRSSHSGLGFEFLCNLAGGMVGETPALEEEGAIGGSLWKNYVKQKQQIFGMLRSKCVDSHTEIFQIIDKRAV